jgi:hypothetical protein
MSPGPAVFVLLFVTLNAARQFSCRRCEGQCVDAPAGWSRSSPSRRQHCGGRRREFSDRAPDRAYADVALLVGKRTAKPRIPAPGNRGGTTASIGG